MRPTVLVSWSGGIDSTSCLWQLLRDGKDVLAHHVVLKSPEGRWEAEGQAIEAQREWFRAQGYTFVYHQTGYDYGTVLRYTRDINITAFAAGQVIAEADRDAGSEGMTEGFSAGHVLIGYPSVTQAVVSASADDHRRQQTGPDIQGKRKQLTELVAGRSLEWLTPNILKPKAEVMREMPADLLSLCWYCRRPTKKGGVLTRCEKCRTCKEVMEGEKRNANPDRRTS
jgi:hypothetical protein